MADISSDKIRQLLSDPKNIELIAGIAGSMNGGLLGALTGNTADRNTDTSENQKQSKDIPEVSDFIDNSEKTATSDENAISAAAFSGSALPSFPPISGMAGINSDKRIALLKAIKPYISDSKKERVDGLVRAISVAGILNNYKGNLFG